MMYLSRYLKIICSCNIANTHTTLNMLKKWNPLVNSQLTSYHKYYNSCDPEIKFEIDEIANQLIPDGYARVKAMDELYITAKDATGSDLVFETPHIDGPFGFLPFKLYRCVFAVSGSNAIETCFNSNDDIILKDSDHLMFDYNRDLHYIRKIGVMENDRIVIKLHFVRKQSFYRVFALLNIIWNSFARFLFNKSKNPHTIVDSILAYVINTTTYYYPKLFKKFI